jgi:hypothetical protein
MRSSARFLIIRSWKSPHTTSSHYKIFPNLLKTRQGHVDESIVPRSKYFKRHEGLRFDRCCHLWSHLLSCKESAIVESISKRNSRCILLPCVGADVCTHASDRNWRFQASSYQHFIDHTAVGWILDGTMKTFYIRVQINLVSSSNYNVLNCSHCRIRMPSYFV